MTVGRSPRDDASDSAPSSCAKHRPTPNPGTSDAPSSTPSDAAASRGSAGPMPRLAFVIASALSALTIRRGPTSPTQRCSIGSTSGSDPRWRRKARAASATSSVSTSQTRWRACSTGASVGRWTTSRQHTSSCRAGRAFRSITRIRRPPRSPCGFRKSSDSRSRLACSAGECRSPCTCSRRRTAQFRSPATWPGFGERATSTFERICAAGIRSTNGRKIRSPPNRRAARSGANES